jgi:hypothetical protein
MGPVTFDVRQCLNSPFSLSISNILAGKLEVDSVWRLPLLV